MARSFIDKNIKTKLRILLGILFIEYLTVLLYNIRFFRLNGESLFSIRVDPFLLAVYTANFLKTILKYPWLAIFCNACIIVSFIFYINYPHKNKIAIVLFYLLLIFYFTYMPFISIRNYMTVFFFYSYILFFVKTKTSKFLLKQFVVLFYFLFQCSIN